VKHPKFAVTKRGRFCLRLGGEQRNPSVSFANKSRHAIPHAFMKSLKPENLRVPFHRSLDVAYSESYVINSFQLHEGNLQNCFDQTKESCGVASTAVNRFRGAFGVRTRPRVAFLNARNLNGRPTSRFAMRQETRRNL